MTRYRAFGLLILLLGILFPNAASAGNYKNFEVALYCRVYEVRQMKDPQWLESRWEYLNKIVPIDKVYLETHRDTIVAEAELIQQLKKWFAARGVKTAGGITLTVNEANRFETYCYSKPDHRKKVQEVVEHTARLFDEMIFDDFFFTNCKCDECIRLKGTRSWTDFKLAQMVDVAQNLVAKPARAVNPKVRLTLKYPNWYDHFQYLGYDMAQLPKIFDKIYAGTETRAYETDTQHLQPYQGFSIITHFNNIKPGGVLGGWVDTGGFSPERYKEQLILTLFARPPEITLFDIRQMVQAGPSGLTSRAAPVAGAAFREVDEFLGKLGKPVGLKAYKPPNSSGDDFLHPFIGMIGVPVEITPSFPAAESTILLTEAAKADPALVSKIKKQLADGKTVVITCNLLRDLQDKGLRDIVELTYTDKKVAISRFGGRGAPAASSKPVIFPRILYGTNDAWETIHGLTNSMGYPILLQAGYSKGSLYVLNVPDDLGDFYELPEAVLNQIRNVLGRDLPVRIEGPSKVSLLLYDNNSFIVESFRNEAAKIRVTVPESMARLVDLRTGETLSGQAMPSFGRGFMGAAPGAAPAPSRYAFQMELAPHSYRVFSAAGSGAQ